MSGEENSLRVSVLIVSFNTRELTLECLRSVFREASVNAFEIIVFDNASVDGSVEAVAREFGGLVDLVVSSENLGFAVANNLAAKRASGEYLLLLNPDTVVKDHAIDRLLEFSARNPDAEIWGGRTLFGDGALNPSSCWSKQTIWSLVCQASGLSSLFRRSSLFNPEGIGGWDREGERDVDIVSGCFLMIRRIFWEQLGGFREVFFMYGEEADLCLRANALGAQPMVTSNATIIHYGGASERVRSDKVVRLLKAKNLLIHFHFSPGRRWLGSSLLLLWPLSRYLVHLGLAAVGRSVSNQPKLVWRDILERKSEWFRLDRVDK